MSSVESTVPVLSRLGCLKYHFILHTYSKLQNTLNLKGPSGGVAYGIFSKAKYDLFAKVVASRPTISPLGSCTSGSPICLLFLHIKRITQLFPKLTKESIWKKIMIKNRKYLLLDILLLTNKFITIGMLKIVR
jgi:hypothetical protein